MIRYLTATDSFLYYNENNDHMFLKEITPMKAAEIIDELLQLPEFGCDKNIAISLYIAMKKLQGFSDESIARSCEDVKYNYERK